MKLLSTSQISWDEPLFFVLHLRTRQAWAWRGVIALAIAALFVVVIVFFDRRPRGLLQTLEISLMAGAVLTLLPDAVYFQRNITISDDSINCFANGGVISSMIDFALKDIQRVQLIRPEDWNRSCGGMMLQLKDEGFLVAVPRKVSLETVANVLHRLGVVTELTGWEPSEQDTRIQVKEDLGLSLDVSKASKDARIWPVEEGEGRLSPPLATAVAIVIALGPLFISLLSVIGVGIHLFRQWGSLTVVERCLWGGGSFAAVVVSFVYLLLAGQFLASRYLIGVGKNVLRTRTNTLVTGDEEGLTTVEIFDRTAWTSVVAQSVDFGFLLIDRNRRVLKFEGNKNRWHIPATALTTCRIEEAHVGSEGNENAEKRYYVVISVDRDGQPWEAGMTPTRTELGNDGKEQRHARAKKLMGEIQAAVSPL